jgi:hypothetical protein
LARVEPRRAAVVDFVRSAVFRFFQYAFIRRAAARRAAGLIRERRGFV